MFKFRETFDRLMAAITFAQANEHEIALDIMHDRPKKSRYRYSTQRRNPAAAAQLAGMMC